MTQSRWVSAVNPASAATYRSGCARPMAFRRRGSRSMIVRILTARVRDRHAADFEKVLRAQLPLMREHPGLVYVKLARQAHRDYDDVLLFEEWRDSNALYGWAGADIGKPRLLPGAEGLAEFVKVTHYEALDVDPDDLTPAGLAQASRQADHAAN